MKLESLNAILAAVQACDAPDEDKQEAAEALTSDFSNGEDVSEDDAVGAMPATMKALYQATGDGAPNKEQKEAILADGVELVRRQRAQLIMRSAAPARAETSNVPANTPLTAGNAATILGPLMDRLFTSNKVNRMGTLPVTQRTPVTGTNGNPAAHPDAKVAKFAARVKSLEGNGTRKKGLAIQLAAEEDQAGYDAWHDAKRPEQ